LTQIIFNGIIQLDDTEEEGEMNDTTAVEKQSIYDVSDDLDSEAARAHKRSAKVYPADD
jgi:hypothetical protein